jgi:hypothetical protein
VDLDSYYGKALLWAIENGITNGTSKTTFSPDATVTRAQAGTFIYRFAKAGSQGGINNFADVADDAYYADAIQWAVENGITVGITPTTFSPETGCIRGEIITFLYRYFTN